MVDRFLRISLDTVTPIHRLRSSPLRDGNRCAFAHCTECSWGTLLIVVASIPPWPINSVPTTPSRSKSEQHSSAVEQDKCSESIGQRFRKLFKAIFPSQAYFLLDRSFRGVLFLNLLGLSYFSSGKLFCQAVSFRTSRSSSSGSALLMSFSSLRSLLRSNSS